MKRTEKLFDFYGKHIFLLEISPILVLALISGVQYLSMLLFREYTGVLSWVWFVFIFVSSFFNLFAFLGAARRERYPLQILKYVKFKSTVLYPLAIFLYFLIVLFPLYQSFLNDVTLITIISFYGLPFIMYVMTSYFRRITKERAVRLSLKATLEGINLIQSSRSAYEKIGLMKKYVGWFKHGLLQYSKYFRRFTRLPFEIRELDEYDKNVRLAILVGKEKDLEMIANQIKTGLESVRGGDVWKDDSERFLVMLKNLKTMKEKKRYSTTELFDIFKVQTLSDKISDLLKSPYFNVITFILAILAAIPAIVDLLHRS